MLKRMKIVDRLRFGFALILLGALIMGALGLRSIVHVSELTADIFRHPFAVSVAALEVRSDVLDAQRTMAQMVNRVNSANQSEPRQLQRKLNEQRIRVGRNLTLIRERFLGNPSEVEQIDKALADWYASSDATLALAREGSRSEAIALNRERDALLVENVLKEIGDVSSFAAGKANAFQQAAEDEKRVAIGTLSLMLMLIVAGSVLLTSLITRSVKQSLKFLVAEVKELIAGSDEKVREAEAIGEGNLNQEIVLFQPLKVDADSLPKDEIGVLVNAAVRLSEVQFALDKALRKMAESLRAARDKERDRDWLKSGRNELYALMREDQGMAEMADKVLKFLAEYLNAGVGALYLFDDSAVKLTLTATYAITKDMPIGDQFRLGEGLIGQAAREQKVICLSHVPPDYLQIGSALGRSVPKVVAAVPLLHGNRLIGAIEIGTFSEFSEIQTRFLELAREAIGIGLDANLSHQRMAELLEETQQQAEELQVQQEELQQSNEELEERSQLLEQQRENIRIKNHEIEAASEKLREKATELERVSTYKSEFLANMSHELRTPLNSLMILSSLLMQNKEGNLSGKQVEYAATIHGAGTDLLNLINDILDLSKVEAGQMRFHFAALPVANLHTAMRATFELQAEQKGLTFQVVVDAGVPAIFQSDELRIQQILKNLLSNALKFTDKGQVTLRIFCPGGEENPLPVPSIAFAVRDTGIGISPAQQQLVFNAFQQADGSISRKFGGTGLGLSISLQFAHRMNGDIHLSSQEGQGSEFTLYLPLQGTASDMQENPPAAVRTLHTTPFRSGHTQSSNPPDQEEVSAFAAPLPDDREQLKPGDKCILIIEDDLNYAQILLEIVRERGFAALVAADGESGLALAGHYVPSAIVLDVMLPHIDGWGVMRSLKDHPLTRHIPVHFITCLEDRQKAMAMGAIGFVTKPVSIEQLNQVFRSIEEIMEKSSKKLLIVEDNSDEAKSMVALLEEGDVEISVVASGQEAIQLLAAEPFDCMILDLGLSDMSGFDLLEYIQKMDGVRRIPVIIHSGRELTREDERKLRRFAESIIIKGAKSPERLLNEVSLFLHLVESNLHPSKQRMIRTALDKEAMLEGRKVLLVDDDMRNIFSLSSVLAEKNMTVIEAENGREALSRLEEHHDMSIVLMDIMMPEMDGYTAIREIRKDPRFENLPIIAMTAKALKGDQEKCLAAGASDYIAKPIEIDKLFSLIRVWMFQQL